MTQINAATNERSLAREESDELRPRYRHEKDKGVMPSARLLELCRAYLAMVDEPDGHTSTPARDAERAAAHDALIEQMCVEDFIGTPNRVQARWLARYFVQTDLLKTQYITPREGRTLLFWRVNSEPLYPKLEAFPPFDEHEERAALAFYKPVWVKISAFFKEAQDAI